MPLLNEADMKMPERIARLEKDARNYPIPWNVLRADDGTPFFTINNDQKAWEALFKGLCPICGEKLGKWKWFAGGIGNAFHEHGWYIDLPGHAECITFALQTCPYLALPKYLGRIDVTHAEKLPAKLRLLLNETVATDRPEVFVAVGCEKIELQANRPFIAMPYLRPARPALAYQYWRHGKRITDAEAMPFLKARMGEEWTLPRTKEL